MGFIFPMEFGGWQGEGEGVADNATDLVLRGQKVMIPPRDEYAKRGITLEEPSRILRFELCRFLADDLRDLVLATAAERRMSIGPGLVQILQLEEWRHINVLDNEQPSRSETFRQLSQILETGDLEMYRPTLPPNTHWSNWPEGGML
jgi:hypothetical protein